MTYGSRVLGVLALWVPLACDGNGDATGGTGGSSGGQGAGRGGGSSGAGGAGGKLGTGGSAGAGKGGRAGSAGTGGGTSGGSAGVAGKSSVGGSAGEGGAGRGGTGGSGEGGEGGAGQDDRITWSELGFISAADNAFGIQGSWFVETDCADAMPEGLPCTVPDPAMTGPDSKPGWTVTRDAVCTKGTAPQVINDDTGMPAYVLQWGMRVGFELNSSGAARGPFDAEAEGVRGFTVDIINQTVPSFPPDLRINIVTSSTEENPHFVTAVLPVANMRVSFAEALQGSWVTAPVRLDTTALTAVTFQVYTNSTAAKPYDFCISNLRVIR